MISFPARSFAPLSVAAALVLSSCATSPANAPSPPPPSMTPLAGIDASNSYGLFLSAQSAMAEGKLGKAANLFDQASAASPSEPFLRAKAFSVLLVAGQTERAAAVAAGGAMEGDDSISGLGLLTRAVEALADGRGREAVTLLSDTSSLGPHAIAAALLMPWAAAEVGDWKTATAGSGANTEKLVAAFSGMGRALLLERAGRAAEAEGVYKNLTGAREALFALAYGAFLERHGRGADAVKLYNQALEQSPEDPSLMQAKARALAKKPAPPMPTLREGAAQALVNPAALLLASRQSEVGLGYLRLALRLDPNRAEAWVLAGETVAGLGDTDGARFAYEQVKPNSESYASARARLALSYQQSGDKAEALKIVQQTLTVQADDPATEVVYAELLRDAQRYDEAVAVLDKVIVQAGAKGGDARLYYLRGANEERAGRWSAAESDLRRSLKLAPNEAEVLNYLGFAWVDRGEHLKEALDMLQRAAAIAPESGAIIDSLGWARYRLKDYTAAVKDLERAVVIEAGDPEINDHLGDAYWRVGRKTEAVYQWRRVLTLQPDDKLRTNIEGKIKNGLLDPLPGGSPLPGA